MIERLSRGPAPLAELARPLNITLSATLQHVKVLEISGLVETSKAGRVRTCRMRAPGLTPAESWIAARRAEWERRLDRLGDVIGSDETGS